MYLSSCVVFHRYSVIALQYNFSVNGTMVPIMELFNEECGLCQWLAAVEPRLSNTYNCVEVCYLHRH